MAISGLTRTPYYPVLNAIFTESPKDVLVFSALLYWCSRFRNSEFNERTHLGQFAIHLNLSFKEIKNSLNTIKHKQLLKERIEQIISQKDPCDGNPQSGQTIKENILLSIDYHKLASLLAEKGFNLSPKVLKHCADDSFDFFATIYDGVLLIEHKLLGSIQGEVFDKVALNLAKLLNYIANYEEDFAFKALAPGWRMLIQPPATAEDIASRWLKKEERAIDIEFSDGVIFIPDGDKYGALEHVCHQKGKIKEAKILAVAFMLTAQHSSDNSLKFISDLKPTEINDAINLVNRALAITPTLSKLYYEELNLI